LTSVGEGTTVLQAPGITHTMVKYHIPKDKNSHKGHMMRGTDCMGNDPTSRSAGITEYHG